MPQRNDDASRELQLETRHLALLVALVVALCVASFMLGRWVERQNQGTAVAEILEAQPGAEVEDEGDLAKDLTFFDTLKTDSPAPFQAAGSSARPPTPPRDVSRDASGSTAAPPRTSSARRSVNEGVMIQVFASRDRAAAEAIRKRLRSKGYTALMISEGGSYKIRVGPYADREEAERSAAVLREQEDLKTWIP